MGVGEEEWEGKGLSAKRERGMGVKVQDSTVAWAAIGLEQRSETRALGVQLTDIMGYTAGREDDHKWDMVPPFGR